MNWGYALKYRGTLGWTALATLGSPDRPDVIAQRLLTENPEADRAVVYDRPWENRDRHVLLRIRQTFRGHEQTPPSVLRGIRMPDGTVVTVGDWQQKPWPKAD